MVDKAHEPEVLSINGGDLDVFVYLFFTGHRNWVHRRYLLQWDDHLVIDPRLHAVGLDGRQGPIATEGHMNIGEIESSGDRSGGCRQVTGKSPVELLVGVNREVLPVQGFESTFG